MSNLLPQQRDAEDIPFAVQAQLAELPKEAQQDFIMEFQRRKKEVPIAYLAHFTTLSEGYLDNWTLQIFFWLSFSVGIGPFWWLINLFRLPGKVRRYNKNMAGKVLRFIHYKHKIAGKGKLTSLKGKRFESPSKYIKQNQTQLKPKDWKVLDPDTPSLENMHRGYLVDHGLETWEVVSEGQYDWEDGHSEKIFKLNQVGTIDSFLVIVQRESGHLAVHKAIPVNIYAIDEGLEMEIMERKRPFNVLKHQGVSYFREYTKTGYAFNLSNKMERPTEIIAWTYFDEVRRKVLRIEKHGEGAFKAYVGTVAAPLDFSDIMQK